MSAAHNPEPPTPNPKPTTGRPRLPTEGEALHEILHALQLSQDHLGQGGGYFDVASQQAPPMEVSLEMAAERARARAGWVTGEWREEGRVKAEVVEAVVDGLLWEAAGWLVGVVGSGGGVGEEGSN